MKLASLFLCMYPRSWRIRYESEFTVLLEQLPVSASTIFDLLYGVVDAWLCLTPFNLDAQRRTLMKRTYLVIGLSVLAVGTVGAVLSLRKWTLNGNHYSVRRLDKWFLPEQHLVCASPENPPVIWLEKQKGILVVKRFLPAHAVFSRSGSLSYAVPPQPGLPNGFSTTPLVNVPVANNAVLHP